MLRKRVLFSLFAVFLTACQSYLPLSNEQKYCENNIEATELRDIDYLLYANRMVDAMVESSRVREILSRHRMKLMVLPIINNTSEDIELLSVNKTVYNRLLRSGHFIMHQDIQTSDYQFSGAFDEMTNGTESCAGVYKTFSLYLKSIDNEQIIWSEKKFFN